MFGLYMLAIYLGIAIIAAAISTCPGSVTTSWKRTDYRAMDGHDPKCATFRALPAIQNCS